MELEGWCLPLYWWHGGTIVEQSAVMEFVGLPAEGEPGTGESEKNCENKAETVGATYD